MSFSIWPECIHVYILHKPRNAVFPDLPIWWQSGNNGTNRIIPFLSVLGCNGQDIAIPGLPISTRNWQQWHRQAFRYNLCSQNHTTMIYIYIYIYIYIQNYTNNGTGTVIPSVYLSLQSQSTVGQKVLHGLPIKCESDSNGTDTVIPGRHIDGILPKGPYPPCLRMADRALLAGYPQHLVAITEYWHRHCDFWTAYQLIIRHKWHSHSNSCTIQLFKT